MMTRCRTTPTLLVSAVLMLLQPTACAAWTSTTTRQHVSSCRAYISSNTCRGASRLPPTMYIESPDVRLQIPDTTTTSTTTTSTSPPPLTALLPPLRVARPVHKGDVADDNIMSVLAAAETSQHGMPWKQSISADYKEPNLFYMPFWEWQMQFMKDNLTNLRSVPVVSRRGTDMSYVQNGDTDSDATMRMHTCSFSSDEYKLIRLTVLDAGYRTQVFTSLWYPAGSTQPVLGIDLLQFNHAKKYLCIVDFQPVDNTVASSSSSSSLSFEDVLEPIRSQYPSLQEEMTDRFYNHEDSFFSKQMLLGRHNKGNSGTEDDTAATQKTATSMVYDDLFPAYQQYVAAHVNLVRNNHQEATTMTAAAAAAKVAACHAAYDTYSAARDPAHALLARAFGQEWADDYVYDILFPSAVREESSGGSSSQP